MFTEGKEIDALTATQRAGSFKPNEPTWVFDISQKAQPSASLSHHIGLLRDQAARRRLRSAGQTIAQLDGDEVIDLVQHAQKMIDDVVHVGTDGAKRIGDDLSETLDRVKDVQEGNVEPGLPTGFYDLDHKLGGLTPGQMVIVAARPGYGKSTIGVDIMRHLSVAKNEPTLIFSLEMSRTEVEHRILSAESEVRITSIRKGEMMPEDWDAVSDNVERIEAAPLFIDDSPQLTMIDIAAQTKMMVKRHGVKLVVIDYLQLLQSGKKVESRQQEVSDFSRQIKLLAKSCNIPIIAIAQLNRGVEMRGEDARPKPSDLRESGSLEQDADVILLLHRPDAVNKDSADAGTMEVIVAKNRGGETGQVQLANQLHFSRFTNMAHY